MNLEGKYRRVKLSNRDAWEKNEMSFQPEMLTMKKGRSPSLSFHDVQMD